MAPSCGLLSTRRHAQDASKGLRKRNCSSEWHVSWRSTSKFLALAYLTSSVRHGAFLDVLEVLFVRGLVVTTRCGCMMSLRWSRPPLLSGCAKLSYTTQKSVEFSCGRAQASSALSKQTDTVATWYHCDQAGTRLGRARSRESHTARLVQRGHLRDVVESLRVENDVLRLRRHGGRIKPRMHQRGRASLGADVGEAAVVASVESHDLRRRRDAGNHCVRGERQRRGSGGRQVHVARSKPKNWAEGGTPTEPGE